MILCFFFLFIKEPANNVPRCTTGRSLHERAWCPVFLLFVKCNITYVAQSFVWKPWRSVTELESHCGPSWSCLSDDCLSRELLWRRTDLKKKKKKAPLCYSATECIIGQVMYLFVHICSGGNHADPWPLTPGPCSVRAAKHFPVFGLIWGDELKWFELEFVFVLLLWL